MIIKLFTLIHRSKQKLKLSNVRKNLYKPDDKITLRKVATKYQQLLEFCFICLFLFIIYFLFLYSSIRDNILYSITLPRRDFCSCNHH